METNNNELQVQLVTSIPLNSKRLKIILALDFIEDWQKIWHRKRLQGGVQCGNSYGLAIHMFAETQFNCHPNVWIFPVSQS
jgi:hypothetical protein